MKDNEYNGWTNKPTWLFNVWISNDIVTYNVFRDEFSDILDETIENVTLALDKESAVVQGVSEKLKGWCQIYLESEQEVVHSWGNDNRHPDGAPKSYGLVSDLLVYTIDTINWKELAEHYIEDYLLGLDIPYEGTLFGALVEGKLG